MKYLYSLMIFSTFGCHTYNNSDIFENEFKNRKNEPLSRIIISHQSCTECLDGFIEGGTVIVPSDLKEYYGDTLESRDLILVGNFPLDLLEHNKKFDVQGKLISVDKKNLKWKNAPVFYVAIKKK